MSLKVANRLHQDTLGNRRTDGISFQLYERGEYMSTYYSEAAAISRAIGLSRERNSMISVWKVKYDSGKFRKLKRVAEADQGVL